MYGPWWDRRSRSAESKACLEGKGSRRRPASRSAANRRTLQGSRRESDVVRGKQTPLEHRQHVHQSAKALRARRALLCRQSFKSFLDESGGAEHNSGARRWNRMGQKAFWYSLGTSITTDHSTRSQGQRVRRGGGGENDGAAAASGERCAGSKLLRVVGPLVVLWFDFGFALV